MIILLGKPMKKLIFAVAVLSAIGGCTVARTAGSAAVTTGQVALGAADIVL